MIQAWSKLDKKTQTWIVIGLAVFIILIAVYIKGRRDASTQQPLICRVLGIGCYSEEVNDSDKPDVPTTAPVTNNIEALATRLHDTLKEIAVIDTTQRCNAFMDALDLADNEFIALCNYYKNRFNQTLRNGINSTWWGCDGFGSNDAKNQILSRIDALNIP